LSTDRVAVLDHGYLQLVESWGSDERIIEAARMSTDGAFRGWGDPRWTCQCGYILSAALFMATSAVDRPSCPKDPAHVMSYEERPGDEKLLAYLYNHRHMSPFEMAGMIIEVQAPIFVVREWQRHRTQSYNELSARYAPLPDVNYVPSVERIMQSGGANKQASGTKPCSMSEAAAFRVALDHLYRRANNDYTTALESGIPKELARLVLPVGRYSRMRASANLRNWLQFLTLRTDPAAQWEIRQYALGVSNLIRQLFPRTHDLFLAERRA